jgi:hypothetical protein
MDESPPKSFEELQKRMGEEISRISSLLWPTFISEVVSKDGSGFMEPEMNYIACGVCANALSYYTAHLVSGGGMSKEFAKKQIAENFVEMYREGFDHFLKLLEADRDKMQSPPAAP